MSAAMTQELAARFAALTLRNVTREYPHAMQHVLAGEDDFRPPRQQHPIFFGCFDWHSCVHGYWQLARLVRVFPQLSLAQEVCRQFDRAFTPGNVSAEIAYFNRPTGRGFERPYGWAWLLALAAELHQPAPDDRAHWHAVLEPLATLITDRLANFLPQAVYPIRAGTHSNTAFAMTLSHGYCVSHGNRSLQTLIERQARHWYGHDTAAQAWEPSLDDFLSPTLIEAACMQTVLKAAEFRLWFDNFLPRLHEGYPPAILSPAVVSDRTDGKIAHLDGLNFSRAWCMRKIAASLDASDPRVSVLRDAADSHVDASLPHIEHDYAGEHWLATFAILAIMG